MCLYTLLKTRLGSDEAMDLASPSSYCFDSESESISYEELKEMTEEVSTNRLETRLYGVPVIPSEETASNTHTHSCTLTTSHEEDFRDKPAKELTVEELLNLANEKIRDRND